MSCEHLVCAACAGPVSEGRCPTCRAAKDHVHGSPFALSAQAVALLAVLTALVAVLLAR